MNSRSEKIFQALRQNQAKEGKCGETNISHCSRENIIRSHNELSNEGPSSPEQSRQRQPRDEPMLPLNDNIMTENHSDQSYYATMAKESNQSCSTSTGICLTDASKENVLKGETSFCTSPEKSEHDEALVGLCVPLTEKSNETNTLSIQTKSYVIENRSSTKMSLRKVLTSYKECPTPEREPFSSGSSDDYVPSDNESSSSSRSKTPDITATVPDENTESPVKGKKRIRRPETWVKAKAKKQKNSGREYLSSSGKVVAARSMKPPCPDKCILSCSKKIPEDFRRSLFQQYWELTCLQQQRNFLGSCVEQLELSYRRISAAAPRKPNCAFYLQNNGEKVRVCKTFLLNTLGLSERTLRTVISAKISGTGIIPTDKRGKHANHKKTSAEILNSIRKHIDSIPRIESHYVRADTSRQFIDGGLSIAELYRHFAEERSASNKEPANYDIYAKIFNTEYNIGFFAPKKDQCDLCESHQNAVGDEKTKLEESYKTHLEEKELSRKDKAEEKDRAKNQEIMLAAYDLQAVMPVPMGHTSAFFYKSRLNCFNFTVSINILYFLNIPT